jgi:hypothetical protein
MESGAVTGQPVPMPKSAPADGNVSERRYHWRLLVESHLTKGVWVEAPVDGVLPVPTG